MPRAERRSAIEALQLERGGTTVITYITSTRQGAESQMAMDAIAPIYDSLRALHATKSGTKIDLFLHSNGGEGIVPWRLVTLLREFCEQLAVLVPNRAFSAATLTALGADEVVMHPMGMLGPTDPTVANPFNPPNPSAPGQLLGISVEDVASYIALVKEDIGIRHEDELIQAFAALADKVHPLALGNVKRSTSQSKMLGEKLLRSRSGNDLADHSINEIVDKLTSQLYFHGHPINRQEARDDVGLTFVKDATPAVADMMWNLYSLYEREMHLEEPFQPVVDAIALNPLPVAISPDPMQFPLSTSPIGPNALAYVESTARSHVYEVDYEVALRRDFNGAYGAQLAVIRQAWRSEGEFSEDDAAET
jgi:Serine dehydrogenase proteinase